MNDRAELLIDSRCRLGEGPLWHPERQELFWFDIDQCRFYRADASGAIRDRWVFDAPAAAAAIVDRCTLLIAGAGALFLFDIETGAQTPHLALEADKPGNRANDSRVAPGGGFWIGTMSLKGEEDPDAGAIYFYREGALERLFAPLAVPNAICFSSDGAVAYLTDTPTRKILRCPLDPATGRPTGPLSLFADTSDLPGQPDGAVVDAEGCLWNARWGGGAVIRFTPRGTVDRIVTVPVPNVTCPSFGGTALRTLFLTTAGGEPDAVPSGGPAGAGGIFALEPGVSGLPEPRVRL